ncbi:MAG: fluoride efflux transporter CrcB [Paenibacillus macerans]|uniref:Fluoride-specific ion channel FluC n=1 Tax=Paenibacillus macerans TaxID=44252 RepID=A0A6N8ES93_PAEMA|nr:fluoride efflux transporter CrcB [Paenibacillus macerans]MBS5913010.1 fluoride efflux transporter CrcB [Paenibacillus macerans]MDU5948403.1 fluoride efflux transporter CrcB [Paenibacillus macerans]MDU7477117.1 fluoride efflux transporter CrcB [Paenibacillus macerans]MEC0139974.1 fluoride efflux transporter CrcB [Paenibacillus macerans]MEC0330989.1 fluoride efflux transporter CrcB [Paenibacillus macerans]
MDVIALIVGGFFGSLLRYGLGVGIPSVGSFPLSTVIINLTGCLFLGWFFTIAPLRKIPSHLRLGLGTGFTGAFTTFSTFSVQTLEALSSNRPGTAAAYALANVIGGLLMAGLGVRIAGKNRRRQGEGAA